jgi:CrcB protein
MHKLALTFAGGFCGAITRYLLSAPLLALMDWAYGARLAFPFDILFINLSGAFLLGALYGLFEHGAPLPSDVRLTLGTGFLGAYTTFSSLVVGSDQLVAHGYALLGAVYVLGSMAGGMALAFAGFWLAGFAWRATLRARRAAATAALRAEAWAQGERRSGESVELTAGTLADGEHSA